MQADAPNLFNRHYVSTVGTNGFAAEQHSASAVAVDEPRVVRPPAPAFERLSQDFFETIEGSKALKARARAIRDEIAHVVTAALSGCVGREQTDPEAQLAAGLLVATWTVALIQAHRTFRQGRDTEEAKAAFLAIVDQGTIGLTAAMAGTPYA